MRTQAKRYRQLDRFVHPAQAYWGPHALKVCVYGQESVDESKASADAKIRGLKHGPSYWTEEQITAIERDAEHLLAKFKNG